MMPLARGLETGVTDSLLTGGNEERQGVKGSSKFWIQAKLGGW